MERSLATRDVWRMSSPSFVLPAALSGFVLFLGGRGLWPPVQAAPGFGLPLLDGDAHGLRIEAARGAAAGTGFSVGDARMERS